MNKKLKLLLVLIILAIGTFVVYQSRSSYNQDNPLPTNQNNKDQQIDASNQSAEGKIVYANCGNSDTSCDGFGFIDTNGKYWLIGMPNPKLSEYAKSNSKVSVTFKTTTSGAIQIITIAALP